eukprot:1494762-Prymnesium_polylepis.2
MHTVKAARWCARGARGGSGAERRGRRPGRRGWARAARTRGTGRAGRACNARAPQGARRARKAQRRARGARSVSTRVGCVGRSSTTVVGRWWGGARPKTHVIFEANLVLDHRALLALRDRQVPLLAGRLDHLGELDFDLTLRCARDAQGEAQIARVLQGGNGRA